MSVGVGGCPWKLVDVSGCRWMSVDVGRCQQMLTNVGVVTGCYMVLLVVR